jgi:hypothetical protein
LNVHDIRGPRVREGHLAYVEEDGFQALAGDLLCCGSVKEIGDDGPEGVLRVGVVVALDEVEGTRAVCGSACEAVAEGCGAGLDFGAVGEGEFVVRHVLEGLCGVLELTSGKVRICCR